MKKRVIWIMACCLCVLLMGLTACGSQSGDTESTEASQETAAETTAESEAPAEEMSAEDMNKMMIGAWVPAKGVENDTVAFGYTSDSGYSADPAGQLSIQVDYVLHDGGGACAAEYALKDGKLVYTTIDSPYNAGGEIEKEWVIGTDKLAEGKAVINGVEYEKVTDDPADPDNKTGEAINSRLMKLLAGVWEGFEGRVEFKLNEDGTVNYSDTAIKADGTWKNTGGMMIELTYTNPYSKEEEQDYYHYVPDGDYMDGQTVNKGKFVRK